MNTNEFPKISQELKDYLEALKVNQLPIDQPLEHERPIVGVQVDVDCSKDQCAHLMKSRFEWRTKRSTLVHFMDFDYNEETKTLTFFIGEQASESWSDYYGSHIVPCREHLPVYATAFPDYCFIIGEGSKPEHFIEVRTKVRPSAKAGDLTWLLPSKFADDILEAVHVMNATVLEGLMFDSILYGPFYLVK